jgi:hypothetical protein
VHHLLQLYLNGQEGKNNSHKDKKQEEIKKDKRISFSP